MTLALLPLLERLSAGVATLPEIRRQKHLRWLLNKRQPDGGWAGRKGVSDAYYTDFAMRTLLIQEALSEEILDGISVYLKNLPPPKRLHDVFSQVSLEGVLRAMRGGDAALFDPPPFCEAEGGAGPYQGFLAKCCLEWTGREPLPILQEAERWRSFRRSDGGFAQNAKAKRGGVNPTAAALALLDGAGALTEEVRLGALQFIAGLQDETGGIRASAITPAADLLSTFTGLVALFPFENSPPIDQAAARRFVLSLEGEEGGFRAGAWDTEADPEYLFYGLGVEALLRE